MSGEVIPAWARAAAGGSVGSRLICLPFAGGAASFYRPWMVQLAPSIGVVPVQLPGREERFGEPAFDRLWPLVAALVQALRPVVERGPFALFGHSMGALAAYEFARALARDNLPGPTRRFVSARRAPHLAARLAPMHDLPEPEFVDRLRQLNGTPEAVLASAELMKIFAPVLRADFAVTETYEPLPPREVLTCGVTALGGSDDPHVTAQELRAWQAVTRAPLALHMFAGDHFYLEKNRAAVLEIVRQTLHAGG